MSDLTEEDKSVFSQAMQDVDPLGDNKQRSHHNPIKQKLKSKAIINATKRKAKQIQTPELSQSFNKHESSLVEQETALEYFPPSMSLEDIKSFKKGQFKLDAQLDLHGLTMDEAVFKLHQFIADCVYHRDRNLLIIHGKGYNSEAGKPILKNLVNQELKTFNEILAYVSAQPKDGGRGAVYVRLKKIN